MKSRWLRLFLVLLCPLITGSVWATTLCSSKETVLFSCQTDHKYMSLCASPVSGDAEDFVQYRFGTKTNIELKFPEIGMSPKKVFRYSWTGGKYGSNEFVNFVIGKDRYVIYEMVDSNTGQDLYRAGLAILKDSEASPKGQIVGELPAKSIKRILQCKHPWSDLKVSQSFGGDDYYDFPRAITSKIFDIRK